MSEIVAPLYKHTYPYRCTYLGPFKNGPYKFDLYYTKTFDGIHLLARYGDKSLQFNGEPLDRAKYEKDIPTSSIGEAWRRAEKKKLPLVNEEKQWR